MRTLVLATTAAFCIAFAAPALAQQSTAPGQQRQSDKLMQEEADKGIKTRNSGEAGFVGQQESPGAPHIRQDVPIRAVRPRLVRAAAKVLKLAARLASCWAIAGTKKHRRFRRTRKRERSRASGARNRHGLSGCNA